jgi:hypothetical protein
VNVLLKGVPAETTFQIKGQTSYNSEVSGRSDFLSYKGGGVSFWGIDDGGRDPQLQQSGSNWDGAVGVSENDAPIDYKWALEAGTKREFAEGLTVGGFANFFYERDSTFEQGFQDSLWVASPGGAMTPEYYNGIPGNGPFDTKLYDVTRASESVQWGGLGTLGVQSETSKYWGIGLIRRIAADEHQQRRVGLQLLTKAAIPIKVARSGSVSSFNASREPQQAILLATAPDAQGEVGVVLRDGIFNGRDSLDMMVRDKAYLLMPSKMVEDGDDFDWAKFKVMQRSA